MIRHIIDMYVTSRDLQDMRDKAADIEQDTNLTRPVKVCEWTSGRDTIRVIVDYRRAREQGLMR